MPKKPLQSREYESVIQKFQGFYAQSGPLQSSGAKKVPIFLNFFLILINSTLLKNYLKHKKPLQML